MKRLFFLAFVIVLMAGCGLFRKKNRCHTCPNWKTVEQPMDSAHDRI